MYSWFQRLWYEAHPLYKLLLPFSWLYQGCIYLRRRYLQYFCQAQYSIPVIVVGNLTVGGVGKTPLVIELAKKIKEKGLKVGIVSRGYGALIRTFPYEIQLHDSAYEVGDEPLLLAQKTQCPVVIAPKRDEAVRYLLKKYDCDLIISDDGLQHYRMGRAVEIVVIDGMRGLGNKACLPAGPLRESPARLKEVDFIIVNEGTWDKAYAMNLKAGALVHMASGQEIAPECFENTAAVAAIGNPSRFYSTLRRFGIEFTPYSYPDHYRFKSHDLNLKEKAIIMTEKDAVKCHSFISDRMYYLPVEAILQDEFWKALWSHPQLQGYC